jgi:hypothetical protein
MNRCTSSGLVNTLFGSFVSGTGASVGHGILMGDDGMSAVLPDRHPHVSLMLTALVVGR